VKDWRTYTLSTIKDLDLKISKKKGQHFLTKYTIVNRMIRAAKIKTSDHIVEIGGGVGILTHALSQTGAIVTVIEKDPKLADHLQRTFPSINVIQGDALEVEWPEDCRVIANLPYNISSPSLLKILHHSTVDAIVMLQKEVAMRCIAEPKNRNYGRLSVLCHLHAEIAKVMDVPPEAFHPRPKVDSQIIWLKKRPTSLQNSHLDIELLTRNLFSLRRRTVRSVIRGYLKRRDLTEPIWDGVPYSKVRVFELSPIMIDEILTYLLTYDAWPLA
jgi:16S rRNA (adenine1518-N6/adenine1519-N6)-dimethyltransferase